MVSCEEIQKRIESKLKGSSATVNNPRGDDVHFSVEVVWDGFKDKKLIEQHKLVYGVFGNRLNSCGESMHAIEIKTREN